MGRDFWRAFLWTPLWAGVPAAAALAFGAVFLLMRLDPVSAGGAFIWGGISAGCVALAWVLGLVAAARPGQEETEERDAAFRGRWRRVKSVVVLIALFVFVCLPDVGRVAEGVPLVVGLCGVLTKLLCIAAIVAVLWLDSRRRG